MYPMKDLVMKHVKERDKVISTSDICKMLNIEDKYENWFAGNIYLAALQIIDELQKLIIYNH